MRYLSFVFALCSSLLMLAQPAQHTFEGCVTDATGLGLVGATVHTTDSTLLAVANGEGCFVFSAQQSTLSLVIAYADYPATLVEAQATEPIFAVLGTTRAGDSERTEEDWSAEASYVMSTAPIAYDAVSARSLKRKATSHAAPVSSKPTASGAARTAPASEPTDRMPAAGQLTAGEVHDFSKWEMWQDIGQEDLVHYRSIWQQYADQRYTLQLTTQEGKALVDVPVVLRNAAGDVVWRTRTDNTGKAECWNGMHQANASAQALTLYAEVAGKPYALPTATQSFKQGINFLRLPLDCAPPSRIDLAFVVDATGSMQDEISYLQSELLDVIAQIRDSLPSADLRMGSVFYRDEGDDYLTRHTPLSPTALRTVAFIKAQQAGGGGDTPEAVDAALATALDSLQWSEQAAARIIFLVLDAPPHHDDQVVARLQALTQQAAAQGIRVVPVGCSGIDKSAEYWLRTLALATNGTYTFLTDDSGIGLPHLEPSTDLYKTEKLNDLMVRLVLRMGRTAECEQTVPTALAPPPTDPAAEWTCWPNPTTGPLQIRFRTSAGGALQLTDSQGKLLERYAPRGPSFDLDLVQYPAGTYYLQYRATDGAPWQSQPVILTGRS